MLMLGVVVMLLQLNPRIWQVHNLCFQSMNAPSIADKLGQLQNGKLLCELIENSKLSRFCGILDRQPNTVHRVTNIEEAAGLAAGAIYRQGKAQSRLHAETIQHRSPDCVVVEPCSQRVVAGGL